MKKRLKKVVYKRGIGVEKLIAYGASARGARTVIGSVSYSTVGLDAEAKAAVRLEALQKILAE